MDDFTETLAIIDSIASVEDADELEKLETALDTLFQSPQPERGIETLFHLYERFPNDDGNGVFWTVLHGIEHSSGHEPYLKASVRRVPMEFNLIMVNRLLNSALSEDDRQEWLALLQEVESDPASSETAKDWAQHFIEYQRVHRKKGETEQELSRST